MDHLMLTLLYNLFIRIQFNWIQHLLGILKTWLIHLFCDRQSKKDELFSVSFISTSFKMARTRCWRRAARSWRISWWRRGGWRRGASSGPPGPTPGPGACTRPGGQSSQLPSWRSTKNSGTGSFFFLFKGTVSQGQAGGASRRQAGGRQRTQVQGSFFLLKTIQGADDKLGQFLDQDI